VHSLKRVKEEHACFHPSLDVFNRFKALYRQAKEFYLYLEASLNSISRVLQCGEASGEFHEVLAKIGYFGQLLADLQTLVQQRSLFSYHSQISVSAPQLQPSLSLAHH